MKVAALVHFAMPYRNAGSETVLHLFLKGLIEAGHEVVCWVTDVGVRPAFHYEGVDLRPFKNVALAVRECRAWKPDVIISHHQNSALVNKYANSWGAKSVYMTHNDMDVNSLPLQRQPDLVVHNSEWVKQSLQRYDIQGQQIVIHPPLDCQRHTVEPTGDALTLININEHKGGKIFAQLAARMRDIEFQAVLGGHGVQTKPVRLSNLEVVKHSPDLQPVWRKTKLLLMPSIYESYGLVGIEAGCSGIPTLANDTPGLRESLGFSGNFVSKRENLDEWEAAIRAMLEPDNYRSASILAKERSAQLCTESGEGIRRFVKAVENL